MRKKVMIAIDGSIYARHALNYAIQLSQSDETYDFVLFHVQPMISQYLVDEALKRSKAKQQLNAVYQKNREASHQLLEDSKAYMTDKGLDAARIEIKTQIRNLGIAEDVLAMAEAGSYDAILIGRRGISGLLKLVMGSVTSDLLLSSQVIPVWVVDDPLPLGSVLIAVDGSSLSLRAVDHVAYMFSENRTVRLHFLNIEPRLGDFCEIDTDPMQTAELEEAIFDSNQKCIADFSAKAMGILKKSGLTEKQITFESVQKQISPGKAILKTMEKGGFGTVVVGKVGSGNATKLGSVARHMIQKISNGALWVVP